MKSLKYYLMESIHTYNYRIRVAGDIDDNKLELLKYNLQKFSPVRISEPKTTPIQKAVAGFPGINNERVTTIEMDCRYPVIDAFVKQMAQLLGIDPNRVRMVNTNYDDSIDSEMDGYVNQMDHSPLLTHEELEEQHGAKDAVKAYGNMYLDSIKEQTKDDKIVIPFEGKPTPPAFDPFKPETYVDKKGQTSPMSHITRPAKPQTGAHKG
jgi:hypothetical protein